ncbi:MAG: hypothetical protein WCK70_04915, partial [Chloroflexales bacterium]
MAWWAAQASRGAGARWGYPASNTLDGWAGGARRDPAVDATLPTITGRRGAPCLRGAPARRACAARLRGAPARRA